jgi:KaiC/GvpD/RAD55 family RecA-like ATPase
MVELETVFRSIVNFKDSKGQPTIPQEDLVKNFRVLQQVVPEPPDDKAFKVLYHFLLNYVRDCDTASPELPSYEFVKTHFETVEGNETVLALLERIRVQQPYVGQDYKMLLKQYNDDQRVVQLERVLSNVNKIASTGMEVREGKMKMLLRGVVEGINYFARETKNLIRDLTGVKMESQIVSSEDAREVMEEYEKVKKDPTEALGIYTGISHMDAHLKGLKNTELMIMAAWTGHCKTTFCLNMAYRALYSGWNTLFVTLEMTFQEIRRAMYVLHSCNQRRFRERYPEYADIIGKITFNNVTYGELSKKEEEFYSIVCRDFEDAQDFGRFTIWQPSQSYVTVSDVDFKARQVQQEYQATGRDLEFTVIDYISLLSMEKEMRSRDHNENLNMIVKALKRECLTFNNGKGMRILSPWQVNREGYKEARANDGIYFPTCLSNAHETERSADVVITGYMSEEDRKNGLIKFCNLKNRRDKFFDPFYGCVDLQTKYIYDFSGDASRDPIQNMELVISKT